MAIAGWASTNSAIEMQLWGKPCTKFMVPSIGSIIQVGASVNVHVLPEETDSSPINLWSGNLALSPFIKCFSTCWSTSVTKSMSHDFTSTDFSRKILSLMNCNGQGLRLDSGAIIEHLIFLPFRLLRPVPTLCCNKYPNPWTSSMCILRGVNTLCKSRYIRV